MPLAVGRRTERKGEEGTEKRRDGEGGGVKEGNKFFSPEQEVRSKRL